MNPIASQYPLIPLWPEGAPGSETFREAEEELIIHGDLNVVRNVTQPSLTVFAADPAHNNGAAVIVCPGGAWHFLAIEHEGRAVAAWLAARGVTAFVLRYRLLRTGADLVAETEAHLHDRQGKMEALMREHRPLMRADAQQAVRLVRARAAEWGVRPDRVGMLGFSAGGDFTARAVLDNPPDARPDFAAPIYPAVFEPVTAPAGAPPLFLLCANDDEMAVNGCRYLHDAWRAAQRPVELHIYAAGGHGFGMNPQGLPSDRWIERFWEWMQAQGLVGE